MDDPCSGIADALVEGVVLGGNTKEFFDFVLRIELKNLFFADPGLGVRLGIVDRDGELQRIPVDAAVPLLDACLVADRITKMIQPCSLIKTERVHDEGIPLPS